MASKDELFRERLRTVIADIKAFVKEMQGSADTMKTAVDGFRHRQTVGLFFVAILLMAGLSLSIYIMQKTIANEKQIKKLYTDQEAALSEQRDTMMQTTEKLNRTLEKSTKMLHVAQLKSQEKLMAELRKTPIFKYFRPSDLSNANLKGAILKWANLAGANLYKSILQKTDFEGADLSRTNLSYADFSGANLKDTNLAKANLINAKLTGAVLRGADLSDANLSAANIDNTNFAEANLSNARLKGATLRRADLSRAYNLTREQVNEACIDEKTKLSESLSIGLFPMCK